MVKPNDRFKPTYPSAYQPPSHRVIPRPDPTRSPELRSPLTHRPSPDGIEPDAVTPPEKPSSASPTIQSSVLGAGSLIATIVVGSLMAEGSSQPPTYTPPASTTRPQPQVTPRLPDTTASAPTPVLPAPAPPEMMPLDQPMAQSLETARQKAQAAMSDAATLLNQQFNVKPEDLPLVQISEANVPPVQQPATRQPVVSQPADNPVAATSVATRSSTNGQTNEPSIAERYRAATASLPELQPAAPFSLSQPELTEPSAAEPQPAMTRPAVSQTFTVQPTQAFVQANPQTQFGVSQGRRLNRSSAPDAQSGSPALSAPAAALEPISGAVPSGAVPSEAEVTPQVAPRSIQDFLELSEQLNLQLSSRSQPAQLPLTRQAAREAADFNYLEQFLVFRLGVEEYRNLWLGREPHRSTAATPQYGFIDYRHRAIVLPATSVARLAD